MGVSEEMLKIIESTGYSNPSLVQEQVIPLAMSGKDVLVSSQTGSGKTASFVIPTVERFKGKNGCYVLALSPTREIALQTRDVFQRFAEPFGLKVVVCIGGADIPQEKIALNDSPNIIVATPGRLCDHLERGNVWLEFIQCLIFDEADRMLDMGFAKQIDMITEQIPKERQTLMLSATFAPDVEKLARKAMNSPEQVIIEKTETTKPKIIEELFWLPEERKLSQLLRIAEREKGTIFVFVNMKEKTYQISRLLDKKGIKDVTYIHSDLQQEDRVQAVTDFKSGKARIIIATDVMGRGIDVDDVAHVVNYDVPKEPEDYIHRIGRTGRRGQTGVATTFAIPGKDDRAIGAIAKLRGVPPPTRPERKEGEGDQRPPRRGGERGPRGPRGPRPQGEREARPEGAPNEGRPGQDRNRHRNRSPRGPRPEGEAPRGPRPEGQRGPRPPRREQGAQGPRREQAPRAQAPVAPVASQGEGFVKRFLKKLGFGK